MRLHFSQTHRLLAGAILALALGTDAGISVVKSAERGAPPSYVTGQGEYDFSSPSGPHHRRVETTVTVSDPNGIPVEKPSRVIQLAAGLHDFDAGQWKPSVELIGPHPRGAAAEQGFYQVLFGKNLNRAGSIELILPDGQKQKNHPLGLYYYDRQTGAWVKISGTQDSEGWILPPHRVLYRNAFADLRADLLYTYEKGRFEADVIPDLKIRGVF